MSQFNRLVLISVLATSLGLGCGAPVLVGRIEAPAEQRLSAQQDPNGVGKELFSALDRNGDRTLSATEAESFLPPGKFASVDRNDDRLVSERELGQFLSSEAREIIANADELSPAGEGAKKQFVRANSVPALPIGIGIGLGAIAVGYLTYAGIKGSHDVMWPKPNQSTTTPADLGWRAEDVTLDADITGLRGWYIPAAFPTDKCVIFQHGHGGNKSQFLRDIVLWLHERYNVLTFDFRGCGKSPKAPSSLGFFEAKELAVGIESARSKGNVSIGLMGVSMGAASSLIAGALDPSVKGVVQDCSFADWNRAFLPRIVKRKYPLPGPVAVAIEKTLEIRLRVKSSGASPLHHIKRWAGRPVFMIHGEADVDTTPDNVHLLYDACPEPKMLWTVPGAGHAQSHEVAPEEYRRRVLDFWGHTL